MLYQILLHKNLDLKKEYYTKQIWYYVPTWRTYDENEKINHLCHCTRNN